MKKNRKLIYVIIMAAFIVVTGCSKTDNISEKKADRTSNNKVENTSETNETISTTDKDTSSGKTEDGLDKIYGKFLEGMKKNTEATEEKIKAIENNLSIMKDLNRKASAYCGSSFYVESVVDNGNVIKEYWQEGNYRYEQFADGKLTYVHVYNKAEDTDYSYESDKDTVKKITNCSKKGLAPNLYEYGFFSLNNNAVKGNFETIDYNGKKAVYSLFTYEGTDKNGVNFNMENGYWYDAETGIQLKEEWKDYEEGKLIKSDVVEITVKPVTNFDESVFKYDENNKEVTSNYN